MGNPALDDPDMFLSPSQVVALVAATPWPSSVMVDLAAWSGLGAAELGGLQVGDVDWPVNRGGQVWLQLRRTVTGTNDGSTYDTTKTRGSDRRMPSTAAAAEILREYLADHPRAAELHAPLFCGVTLRAERPTGKRASTEPGAKPLTAAERPSAKQPPWRFYRWPKPRSEVVLDWSAPLRHKTFYKAVVRPAVLRAKRLAGREVLPTKFKFHCLPHTYASLCAAAGIDVTEVSRYLGHSKVTTTQDIYTHLARTDDSATASMAASDSMGNASTAPNVVPLRRRC